MSVSRLCIISILYSILFQTYFEKIEVARFAGNMVQQVQVLNKRSKKVEVASLRANATLTYFRLSLLFSREQRCYRMLFCLIGGQAEYSAAKGHIEC